MTSPASPTGREQQDGSAATEVAAEGATANPARPGGGVNEMDDIVAFIQRWDTGASDPNLATVKTSEWGNRNSTGQPGAYSAPDFTPADPQFFDAIEPGIRPLVAEIVGRGLITYSSCEGHLYPASLGLDPIARSVSVLPRHDEERRRVRGWFDRTVAAMPLHSDVRVEVRDEVLSDTHGRRVRVVDLVLAPVDGWDTYFEAADQVTNDVRTALQVAWHEPPPQRA